MLTLRARLALILDVSEDEAFRAFSIAGDAMVAEAATRTGQDAERLRAVLRDPLSIARYRLDLNRTTESQLKHLPGVTADRARYLAQSRPVYSIAKAAELLKVPEPLVADIFEVPALDLVAVTGTTAQRLYPTPGTLVAVRSRMLGGFEGNEAAAMQAASEEIGPVVIVREGAGFEAAGMNLGDVSRHFGGWVLPLFTDANDVERCIVPGAFEVWFCHDVGADRVQATLSSLGLAVVERLPNTGLVRARLVGLPPGADLIRETSTTLLRLAAFPEVDFAEPEELSLKRDFEAPCAGEVAVGERDWSLALVNVSAAHAVTRGRPDLTVVTVDSGADLDHPDLVASLRQDWSRRSLSFAVCFDGLVTTSPNDEVQNHGTAVASVIVGPGHAGVPGDVRVAGVAPNVRFIPVRIARCTTYGLRAQAIREATAIFKPGERGVINISWATASDHEGVFRAIRDATTAGHAVVASAGNYAASVPRNAQQPDKPHFPSDYAWLESPPHTDRMAGRRLRGVSSVAAVNRERRKASYSYFGRYGVTIAAPGGEEPSFGAGVYVAAPHGQRRYAYGTSFAAPMVAAGIALLLSAKPSLSSIEAIDVLVNTAADLAATEPFDHVYLGAGLLDLGAAMAALDGPLPDVVGGEQGAGQSGGVNGGTPMTGRLNLNDATADEIALLPFLGPWTADRIVHHRTAYGQFVETWDLVSADLIDSWTFAMIGDFITV